MNLQIGNLQIMKIQYYFVGTQGLRFIFLYIYIYIYIERERERERERESNPNLNHKKL